MNNEHSEYRFEIDGAIYRFTSEYNCFYFAEHYTMLYDIIITVFKDDVLYCLFENGHRLIIH